MDLIPTKILSGKCNIKNCFNTPSYEIDQLVYNRRIFFCKDHASIQHSLLQYSDWGLNDRGRSTEKPISFN